MTVVTATAFGNMLHDICARIDRIAERLSPVDIEATKRRLDEVRS